MEVIVLWHVINCCARYPCTNCTIKGTLTFAWPVKKQSLCGFRQNVVTQLLSRLKMSLSLINNNDYLFNWCSSRGEWRKPNYFAKIDSSLSYGHFEKEKSQKWTIVCIAMIVSLVQAYTKFIFMYKFVSHQIPIMSNLRDKMWKLV